MFKRFIKLFVATSFLLGSMAVFAGGPDNSGSDNGARLGFGVSVNSSLGGAITPNFIYSAPSFDMMIGGSLITGHHTVFGLSFQGGVRKGLVSKLDLTYGLAAVTTFSDASAPGNSTAWGVGPYVGLEYVASQHIAIFANTEPFSFYHNAFDQNLVQFGFDGKVGMYYLF